MAGKQFRGIKARDVIAAFERAGGVRRKKGKGSHVNVKMPNGQIITIPNKGDIKIGLLKAAIVKAGLTDDGFAKLL